MNRPTMSYLERPWRVRIVEPRAELYAQVGADPSPADIYLGEFESPAIAAAVVAEHNRELVRRLAE